MLRHCRNYDYLQTMAHKLIKYYCESTDMYETLDDYKTKDIHRCPLCGDYVGVNLNEFKKVQHADGGSE